MLDFVVLLLWEVSQSEMMRLKLPTKNTEQDVKTTERLWTLNRYGMKGCQNYFQIQLQTAWECVTPPNFLVLIGLSLFIKFVSDLEKLWHPCLAQLPDGTTFLFQTFLSVRHLFCARQNQSREKFRFGNNSGFVDSKILKTLRTQAQLRHTISRRVLE
jgi:hypothetical protein